MKYKIDLKGKFEEKRAAFKKLGWNSINPWKEKVINKSYSKEDELFILNAKKNGMSDKEIAASLNRPYWAIVDKIRRIRNGHH